MENSLEISLKTKTRVTIRFCNPTSRNISEENFNVKRHMYPKVMEVLFTIAKTWRNPKVSTDRWTDKEDVVCTRTAERYSAIKKKEIMPLAATWLDQETVTLSEVGQTQTDKRHMISLTHRIFKMTERSRSDTERQTPLWYHLHTESSKYEYKRIYLQNK